MTYYMAQVRLASSYFFNHTLSSLYFYIYLHTILSPSMPHMKGLSRVLGQNRRNAMIPAPPLK